MKRFMRALKWTLLTIAAISFTGELVDIGLGIADFRASRISRPLEHEFRAVSVGMTKQQVLQLFRPKLSQREAQYYAEVGARIDTWSFDGPWSYYAVAFDPATHLVSGKRKGYPPAWSPEFEPRGRTFRWLWEKWDQIH
jgi:hypothetical protein